MLGSRRKGFGIKEPAGVYMAEHYVKHDPDEVHFNSVDHLEFAADLGELLSRDYGSLTVEDKLSIIAFETIKLKKG